eukprot:GFUD01017176.1.p1 GENE.GFUD01017176.1~~GFUD01017176.1.p1  ORF type:complete len:323 (-),score=104.13 GFUD01017176.1:146-1114(-)
MSIFRNTIWLVKGLREYTSGGFTTAARNFNQSDLDVDCQGKAYMITGANSGIGKQTALEIARRGGTIHMVCRNPEYGAEAKKELTELSDNKSSIHLHILDMSRPGDIVKFVRQFEQENQKLDVLINNAGCMVNKRELTEDQIEKNFATNTLGTFLITSGLMNLLKKSEEPRVVMVSSGGMLVQKLNVDDLQFSKLSPFDGTMAYAQNKRQQVVMTEQLARENKEVHFSVMHPGWADTPAVRNSMPDFYEKMRDKLRTVVQGADTVVWLAVAKQSVSSPSGQFWQDRTQVATHLPLAWTRTGQQDEDRLMSELRQMEGQFSSD